MVRPLSNDLRERVVVAVLAGETSRSVAVRGGGVFLGEMVTAPADDRLGGPGPDGWPPQVGTGTPSCRHRRADRPEFKPDAACPEGGAGGAGDRGLA